MRKDEENIFSEIETEKKDNNFDFNSFISKNILSISLLLIGLILASLGVFFNKSGMFAGNDKVEVLNASTENEKMDNEIVVEVAGAVVKPTVYKLPKGARISDLLSVSGGFSEDADHEWVEKYVNQAAQLADGQKLYIPRVGENSVSQSSTDSANNSSSQTVGVGSVAGATSNISNLVNINTATLSELDKLPGIGPVFGQNIIEQRPYSTVEELLSRKVLRSDVYEKIKDKVSVY